MIVLNSCNSHGPGENVNLLSVHDALCHDLPASRQLPPY